MIKLIIFLFLVSLVLPSVVFAEIYKWTNDSGTIEFTDDLSKVPEEYLDQVEIKEYEDEAPGGEINEDAPEPEESPVTDESNFGIREYKGDVTPGGEVNEDVSEPDESPVTEESDDGEHQESEQGLTHQEPEEPVEELQGEGNQ